jgi:hypothetical protein
MEDAKQFYIYRFQPGYSMCQNIRWFECLNQFTMALPRFYVPACFSSVDSIDLLETTLGQYTFFFSSSNP